MQILCAFTGVQDDIRPNIDAVERGLAVVRQVTRREQEATKPDKYDRVPAEMPTALRALYETGSWHSAPVYCWDLVLKVSAEGHEKAKAAEDSLSHMSFRPPQGLAQVAHTTLRAEHSPAVTAVATTKSTVREAVSASIRAKKDKRAAHVSALNTEYRRLREKWIEDLKRAESAMTQKEKDEKLASDRLLVMATRASSGMGGGMSVKECDACLSEIELSGGTAGGVSRWNSSLATIPEQDLSYSPPDGGILMDDPLADHYAAKNINPWTRAERYLFLEKFISHNKNFRRIATFFEHKSVEDVVRFYFENKKALKLKQLTKEAQMKKRTNKKNALIELSRLPTESRSIKNNFAGEAASAIMDGAYLPSVNESLHSTPAHDPAMAPESALMREAGKGWKPRDQQLLIFALCRHRIDDDFTGKNIPVVWCRISYEVRTKTPSQCRQFYAHFKSLLGLDKYQPPDPASIPKSTPKRPRPSDASGAGSDSAEEPKSNRPRRNRRLEAAGTVPTNGPLPGQWSTRTQPTVPSTRTNGPSPAGPIDAAKTLEVPNPEPVDPTSKDEKPSQTQPEPMDGVENANSSNVRESSQGVAAASGGTGASANHGGASSMHVVSHDPVPPPQESKDEYGDEGGRGASRSDEKSNRPTGAEASPKVPIETVKTVKNVKKETQESPAPAKAPEGVRMDVVEGIEHEAASSGGDASKAEQTKGDSAGQTAVARKPEHVDQPEKEPTLPAKPSEPSEVSVPHGGRESTDAKAPETSTSLPAEVEASANDDATPVSVKVEACLDASNAVAKRPSTDNHISTNGHPSAKPDQAVVEKTELSSLGSTGKKALADGVAAPDQVDGEKLTPVIAIPETSVAGGGEGERASGISTTDGNATSTAGASSDVVVVNPVAAPSPTPASVK